MKFDKSAYQREYMRKKREKAKLETSGLTKDGAVFAEWDKEKYPVRAAWEIAVQRMDRAKRYAEMFPNFVHSSDLKFQDLDWQYENEGLPAVKNPNESKVER